jgi:hypothetical protein
VVDNVFVKRRVLPVDGMGSEGRKRLRETFDFSSESAGEPLYTMRPKG